MAPRIAPLDPPYTPEMHADFDKLMHGLPPLLLFRTVAKNPRVLQRMMAGGLLDRGSISIRSRELIILRTTARCGAEYEWGVHVFAFGSKAQWTTEQLHSSVHGGAADACWIKEDQLVIRLADQLHDTARWVNEHSRLNTRLLDGLQLALLPMEVTVASLLAELELGGPSEQVRIVRTLGWFGPAAAAAVPELIEALGNEQKGIRREAAITLGKIGPGANAAVPALTTITDEPIIGFHAKSALKKIDGK